MVSGTVRDGTVVDRAVCDETVLEDTVGDDIILAEREMGSPWGMREGRTPKAASLPRLKSSIWDTDAK